jgi:hypothetical protein
MLGRYSPRAMSLFEKSPLMIVDEAAAVFDFVALHHRPLGISSIGEN